MTIPLLIIAGPTASGKSAAAVELAQKLNGEVVSADSMQIYKYMNIGTAKVDDETRALVPHHLLDVVEPDQEFSLAQYKALADHVCMDIWQRGKLPIIAGGTGLYIKAVADNYPLDQLPHNLECREELKSMWDARGRNYMVQWLQRVDPETVARSIDKRRIIRALEVYQLTGRAPAEIHREAREGRLFNPLMFALTLPRPQLYEYIDSRTELMVKQGLVGEYISLIERGYSPNCKAMQGLGYRHCGLHVQGVWSLEEMKEQLKQDTRRYAKRQLTWFRGIKDINWLDNTEPPGAIQRIYTMVAGIIDHDSERVNR